ncbi:hypothetical protein MHEL_58080 [Mycolicibacterium helvum]|uniref:Uncharacterized protein n=1 Tax=Mycolicibacterium helvum TaxID=1534349 RepID=A0A7I7TGP5_9MYCO|nr:hypothetical protein MHEL_58080 [Mycolicibacterium helvum]
MRSRSQFFLAERPKWHSGWRSAKLPCRSPATLADDDDHGADRMAGTAGAQIMDSSHAASGVVAITDFGGLAEFALVAASIA